MTEKLCKTCIYGVFDNDPETGAKKWQGRCIAKIVKASDEDIKRQGLKSQTVMQHFKCSNNLYESR